MAGMIPFIIKRCGRAEYREFLDVLNVAFGQSAESEWFQQNIGMCTPYPDIASDDEIARHVIAVDRGSGRVIGGTGAYPFDYVVSEDRPGGNSYTLPAVGIGQVCCALQWRGKGVMSLTLRRALGDAACSGALISFLGGDRYRYGHFGYDYGGGEIAISFNYGRLKTVADCAAMPSRRAGEGDIPQINALYETHPSYIKRDLTRWAKLLRNGNFIWQIGSLGGADAYIAYSAEQKNEVIEAGGDPGAVTALLSSHMKTHKLGNVCAYRPFAPHIDDALTNALWKASSDVNKQRTDVGLTAILNVEKTFEILMGLSAPDCKQKEPILRHLFGTPGQPYPIGLTMPINQSGGANGGPCNNAYASASGTAYGDTLRPLVYWMSQADYV